MKKLFPLLEAIILISTLAVTARSANTPYNYQLIDLSSLLGTTGASSAVDINNNGQIIGQSPGGAFIYSQASGTGTVTYLSDSSALVHAINNNGQVVGAASGHAFLYSDGTVTSLGSDTISANDINDSGQIVGYGNFVFDSEGHIANRGFSAYVNNGIVSLTVLGTLCSDTCGHELCLFHKQRREDRWQCKLSHPSH